MMSKYYKTHLNSFIFYHTLIINEPFLIRFASEDYQKLRKLKE